MKTKTRLAYIQFIFSTFFSNDEVIDELLHAIKFVESKEKIILDSCKTKNFTFAKLKNALLKSQTLKYKSK